MTREELAATVGHLGSVWEAVNNGVTVEDLPEDVPDDISEAWYDMKKAEKASQLITEWLFIREP